MSSNKIQSILLWGGNLDFSDSNAYALNLAVGLKKRNLQIRFYTPGGIMEKEFKSQQIPIKVENFLGNRILDIFKFRTLAREIRHFTPQLIHVQSADYLSPALKLARKLSIPVALTVYGLEDISFTAKEFQWLRGIVAVSEEVREHLVNHLKVPKEIIRVIPPGVDMERVSTVKMYEENQIPVVGTISNAEKGLEDFVLAAEKILQKNILAEFLIAGKGKERGNLEKLAESKGILDRFTFVETLTHSFSVLPLMGIYVATHSSGKFGQNILEAMAWGKAVVAVGSGIYFSLIKDRETGILVPPKDPEAMSKAIEEVISNKELRLSLGSHGKEFVAKQFSLERMMDEIFLFYEKILDE